MFSKGSRKDAPPSSFEVRHFDRPVTALSPSVADAAKGFVLLPRRWVVERTFARLNRNRRLAKDFKATIESAVTCSTSPVSN